MAGRVTQNASNRKRDVIDELLRGKARSITQERKPAVQTPASTARTVADRPAPASASSSETEKKRDSLLTVKPSKPVSTVKEQPWNSKRDVLIRDARAIQQTGYRDPITSRKGFISDYNTLQKSGLYGGNDLKLKSKTQLENDKILTGVRLKTAQNLEDEYKNRTEEEKQAQREDLLAADRYQGALGKLAESGLPVMKNRGENQFYYAAQTADERNAPDEVWKARPEDYWDGNKKTDYDTIMYDSIYGDGAYDRIVFGDDTTDEDIDALENEVNDLWDSLENGKIQNKYEEAMDEFSAKMNQDRGDYGSASYKRMMDRLDAETKNREEIEQYEANAPEGDWAYDPDAIKTNDVRNARIGRHAGNAASRTYQTTVVNGDRLDQIYYKANNPVIDRDISMSGKYYNLDAAQFMSPKQVETFNAYFLSGDRESAKAYYDALEPYLQSMKMYSKDVYETEMSQNEYAPWMIGKRILTQPAAGIMGTAGMVAGALGNEEAKDQDNELFYGLTRSNQNIQGARAKVWGEAAQSILGDSEFAKGFGEWLNGIAYSAADNLVARGIGMGVGSALGAGEVSNLAGNMIQLIMSSEATANEMYNGLKAGRDPTETMLRAFSSGVIEWITEKYSTDKFFENFGKGSIGKQMVASFVPEAQEEASGKLLETAVDEVLSPIFGHESEFKETVNQFAEQYGEDNALGMALMNYAKDLGLEALAGGISGAGMGGAGAVHAKILNYNANVKLGKTAVQSGTVDVKSAENTRENMATEATNEFKLLEAAEKLDPGSEARRIAKEIREGFSKGGKINYAKFGQMVRAIMNESNEQIGNIAQTELGDVLKKQLLNAGEKEADAIELSQVLMQGIVNQALSPEMLLAIHDNKNAMALWHEYRVSDAAQAVQEKIKPLQEAQKSVMDLMIEPKESGITPESVSGMMAGAQAATAEDIAEADANGKRTGSALEVIADGLYGEIKGFTTRNVKGEDGKNHTVVMVQIGEGDAAREVDISQVKGLSDGAAQVLQVIGADRGQVIKNETAKALFNLVQRTKDTAGTVADAMKTMWAAAMQQKAPKTNLDKAAQDAITEAIQKDMDAAEEIRVQNWRKITPGQGRAVYNGFTYGTKQFNDAISKLGSTARNEANVIGNYAKSMGVEVELYYDAEDSARQGAFYGGQDGAGIRINLAGTINKQGAHRSAVATFAHEVTHNIEANSPTAYKALRTFVLQNMKKSGKNLQGELQHIMDNYEAHGESIDLNGAIAEMVAMGSEQVLTSEEVAAQLKQQDPSLFGKVRKAVTRLINQIRGIKGDVLTTSSRYARAMQNVGDRMAKIWLAAYEEAKNAEAPAEIRNGSKEYSFMGIDKTTGASVYLSNYAENTEKKIKQKDFVENIQNVFSKRPIMLTLEGYDGKGTRNILAQFDPTFDQNNRMKTDVGKLAYNKKVTSNPENRVRLNLAGDLQQMMTESVNYDSKTDKDNNPNILQWHYFNDDIYYVAQDSDVMEPYKIDIAIKEKDDGSFVYTYEAVKDESRKQKKLSIMENFASVNTGKNSGESASASVKSISQAQNQRKGQKALQLDMEEYDGTETHYGDHEKFSLQVTDPEELEFLNNQKTVTTYKSMQLIDGKLYPPMAAVVAGSMEDYSELGKWEKATEHPELIKKGNKFTLNKGKGKGSLDAAYNPYMHSSNLMINDQFSGAYNRPNLVTVECKVPVSELTSGYHADFAKDAVGWHSWHTGPVASQLRNKKGTERQVMLSRWIMPVRIVSDEDVAKHYAELLNGTDIVVPDNVVTPSLKNELIKAGVKVSESGRVQASFSDEDTGARIQDEYRAAYDRYTDLRKQESELKGDLDDFNKRIKNATGDETQALIDEIAAWQERTGYDKLAADLREAEQAWKKAQKAWDEYKEQRDEAEEQEKIRESGLTEAEWRRKQAVKDFGYTGNFREAGYLLPNGRLLNFCGSKGQHYGMRGNDHRQIGQIYANKQGSAAMVDFMAGGNIRIMAESPGIDISTAAEPTAAQYTAIKNMAARFADEEYFSLDLTDKNGNNVGNIEYEGHINPSRIVNDIKHYFKTGEVREQSTTSMFHGGEWSIQDDYANAVESGDMTAAQDAVDEYAALKGYTIHAFHGTGRADRVGTVFLPERATSGPMAFFTDSKDIATNYSRDKKDTSINYDDEYGDYYNQFRIKTKNGKTVPVGKLWSTLSFAERQKITEAAKHITLDDDAEEIIYDENAQYGIGNFTDYERKLHGWNSIDTLIDGWLEGGTLWQREEEFLKVLEMAGIKDVIWMNPDYREEKVYDTFLKIQNPFDTESMYTQEFIDGLANWWAKQDQSKYEKEYMGTDFWDKNGITVDEWIEYGRDDIKEGTTHNWTRIPDGVTDYLKSMGHDGIKDLGGKGGGMGHTVWIPFSSEQIKSAEAVTYDDQGNVIPLDERFNDKKKDIRWSMQDDTDYDVKAWMETVPEWSLRTEAEKALLRSYGSLRRKGQMDQLRMEKIDAEIKRLESMQGKSATSEGTPVTTVTVDEALKANGIVQDGAMLKQNGVIIGSLQTGVLNIYDKYKDIRKKLQDSGAFEYDEKTDSWNAKAQNIYADQERDVQKRLEELRIRKQNLQGVMDQTNEELAKITGNEGFGNMMYRQQKVLEDLAYNKTQAEVRDSIEKMEKSAKRVQGIIDENRKKADELESSDVVKRFRELLGTTTADQTAAELKKEFRSTWTKKQIREYLDPIILKMKSGEDFSGDVETLAGILVNSDSRNTYDELEALRGLTITLGKGAQAELKAQNSSLKEIRARLAGTGITVKYGDRSTLEADIDNLRAEYPMIPELGDEKDALENFVSWVEGMKNQSAGNEFYDQRLAEAMAMITGKAAGAAKGIYMPNDPKAQRQVLTMMDFVKGLNAETQQALEALQQVADEMGAMQKAGREASGKTDVLMRDVNVALDYYNRISKISVDEAKQKRTSALIEQLKSETAQKIIKNNEEWRQLIQRDADARKQLDENRKAAAQINTNLRRMYNLLKGPKGTKNIQEYMQGLAREVLGIFARNDADGGRRFLNSSRDGLAELQRLLEAWEKQDGPFNPADLSAAEEAVTINLLQDLDIIREGITAINTPVNGKNKLDTLQQRGITLGNIRDAVSEIYSAIRAEQEVQIGNRRVAVEDAAYKVAAATQGKNYREWTGKLGGAVRTLHKAIVSGNMTPEYFFRTVGNEGLSDLWDAYHWAENRNGLELAKAQARLGEIAKAHGFDQWDLGQTIKLPLEGGETEVTLGQLMSLWATWRREKTLGPAMSEHLTKGGFFAEKDLRDGLLGRTTIERKAHKVTEEDMAKVRDLLTEEQRKFVDDVVLFMSRDMSELGNAASMAAYGIRMYKEKYYFPFQMWDGVKSRKSNDAGSAAAAQDRAFHPSFSKSRQHGANNALVIGDFMQTATDHIAGMINYATMGLANETMQKVLNAQTAQGPYETKRNTRAIMEEAYGKEVMQYLADLQLQLNGGAVRTSRSLGDKAISIFRKNAVAGSLSVALQQPLSYIRAAMLINPKYLTKAALSEYWKDSYKERMAYSGVSVIKEMGRFDMALGQSAREYLMPDGMESRGRKIWEGVKEYSTILPELMDRWTWNRMWVAVKAEQHALHPEMDVKSDEFLTMVGERFNELMRRTQVYDSVLVKSANMRSDNYFVKSMTSFMAEPTLTANVLADAVRSAKQGEKGGKLLLAKAGATFILSAVLQSVFKALMSTGRTPDEKKTWWENFLYRWFANFQNEVDPMQLIPGYSDAITLLKDGELQDDAMGALGKLFTAGQKGVDMLLGNGKNGWYRDLEDSVGQLVQLFSGLPLKNLMRDGRAMWNWAIDQPYADRPIDWNSVKFQTIDSAMNADNLFGVLMKYLGESGYDTSSAAYKRRVYEAMRDGDEKAAQDYMDYLLNGKGVKSEKSIMTGTGSVTSYVMKDYQAGNITRTKADELLKKANPNMKDQDRAKKLDEIDYENETGKDVENYSLYTRIYEAIDKGDASTIRKQKSYLKTVGIEEKDVDSQIASYISSQYKDGKMRRAEAESRLKNFAGKDADDAFWTLDRIDFKKATGKEASGTYYRLWYAMDANKSTDIQSAVNTMTGHGVEAKNIKSQISSHYKQEYLKASDSGKVKIRDAMEKAYKALGLSEKEVNKTIKKWK